MQKLIAPFLSEIKIKGKKENMIKIAMNTKEFEIGHEPFFNVPYFKACKIEKFEEFMKDIINFRLFGYSSFNENDFLKYENTIIDFYIQNTIKYPLFYYKDVCSFFAQNSAGFASTKYIDSEELTKKSIVEDNPDKYWLETMEKFKFIYEKEGWIYFPRFCDIPDIFFSKLYLDGSFLLEQKENGAVLPDLNFENINAFRKNHFLNNSLKRISNYSFTTLSTEIIRTFADVKDFIEPEYDDNHYKYFTCFNEKSGIDEVVERVIKCKNIDKFLVQTKYKNEQNIEEVKEDLLKIKELVEHKKFDNDVINTNKGDLSWK